MLQVGLTLTTLDAERMAWKYKRGEKFRDKWELERFALDFQELFNSFDTRGIKLREYRKLHSLEESVAHASE